MIMMHISNYSVIYRGNVLMNFLISVLAVHRDSQFLMFSDAQFHTFLLSFRNDTWDFWDLPLLISNLPSEVDLDPRAFVSTLGREMFRGEFLVFKAFHTSVSYQ